MKTLANAAQQFLQKMAYVPPDAGAMPLQDPNMAAGMPPALPPGDPNAAAGMMPTGAPPMPGGMTPLPPDPNAMPGGPMPPDPNAMPGGPMPPDPGSVPMSEELPPVQLSADDLKMVLQQALEAGGGKATEQLSSRLDTLEQMMAMLLKNSGLEVPEKPFSPTIEDKASEAPVPGPESEGLSPEVLKMASETPQQRWHRSLESRRDPHVLEILRKTRGALNG